MFDAYDVMLLGRKVGTVEVIRQGLYCHIRCSCTGTKHGIYRLIGSTGDNQIRFGVLVPEGDRLVLQTKMAAKKLNIEEMEFFLESVVSREVTAPTRNNNFKYIPIYPDEPYAYLSKLKNSYLDYRDGVPGIRITD